MTDWILLLLLHHKSHFQEFIRFRKTTGGGHSFTARFDQFQGPFR
jgi:hypothetical protein